MTSPVAPGSREGCMTTKAAKGRRRPSTMSRHVVTSFRLSTHVPYEIELYENDSAVALSSMFIFLATGLLLGWAECARTPKGPTDKMKKIEMSG